ncbi:MAG: RcnB family protein [Sulfuritalea sp.]|nr:RcnB family protein [Sulfuritalea sp.]
MRRSSRLLAFLFAGLFVAASLPAFAEKPDWAGGGKPGHKHEGRGDRDDRGYRDDRGKREDRYDDRRGGGHYRFSDDSRRILIDYYGGRARAGHCPPGLAKKGNGCMPPGQAKKWRVGYVLPADVRYYPLAPEILIRLPPPPPHHRYVQVAGDILMIAIGTSMVVDAVDNILR